ncbi:MAG: hypothetical protein K6E92_05445 [Lachnospiraceae bacterium]|nr:hypothetical protein [Lachnospiraceae bacterium]
MPLTVQELENLRKTDEKYDLDRDIRVRKIANYLSRQLHSLATHIPSMESEIFKPISDASVDLSNLGEDSFSYNTENVDYSIGHLNESFEDAMRKEYEGISVYTRLKELVDGDPEQYEYFGVTDLTLRDLLNELKDYYQFENWAPDTLALEMEELEKTRPQVERAYTEVDMSFHEEDMPVDLRQREFREQNQAAFAAQYDRPNNLQQNTAPQAGQPVPKQEDPNLQQQNPAPQAVNPAPQQGNVAPQEANPAPQQKTEPEIPVEKAAPGEVSYRRYLELHTGEAVQGMSNDRKVTCLSNCMAAIWLESKNRKVEPKAVHALGQQLREIYTLNSLNPEGISAALASPATVRKFEFAAAKSIYGLNRDTKMEAFHDDLQILAESMQEPRITNSSEYKRLYEAVQKAAKMTAPGKYPSDRELADLNMELMVRTDNYIQGKEKLRKFEDGQARFDSAMDALAILNRHTGCGSLVASRISRINTVREQNDQGTINIQEKGEAIRTKAQEKRAKEEAAEAAKTFHLHP